MKRLTQARAKQLLDFNPQTGDLIWKRRPETNFAARVFNMRLAGKIAGSGKSYLHIKIDMQNYTCHRVIWLIAYGSFPKHQIDHIDLNRRNNRLSNLREATASQNACNKRMYSNNSSQFKGVYPRGKSWVAQIKLEYKTYQLGSFKTPQAAYQAYCAACIRLHGEFSRTK